MAAERVEQLALILVDMLAAEMADSLGKILAEKWVDELAVQLVNC